MPELNESLAFTKFILENSIKHLYLINCIFAALIKTSWAQLYTGRAVPVAAVFQSAKC